MRAHQRVHRGGLKQREVLRAGQLALVALPARAHGHGLDEQLERTLAHRGLGVGAAAVHEREQRVEVLAGVCVGC